MYSIMQRNKRGFLDLIKLFEGNSSNYAYEEYNNTRGKIKKL